MNWLLRSSFASLLFICGTSVSAAQVPAAGGELIPMTPDKTTGAEKSLVLAAGTGRVVTVNGAAANIFVADPKVVQVRPASPSSLFVFGLIPGETTIAALDASGHPLTQFNVTVHPSSYGAASASAAIAKALPDSHVVLTPTPGGMIMTGEVADPADAHEALGIAQSYLPSGQTLQDNLNVASSATVELKVRITEMSRQVTQSLGVDWSALGTIGKYSIDFATANGVASTLKTIYSGNNVTVDNIIEALAADNLVHILAEPNLTARSGESASFLVGGEYPIPVSQGGSNGSVTIQYKQYGVSLSFVPTVLSSGRISLKVQPEVSQLATSASAGAVTLSEGSGSLQIPALTVTRAKTTLELGSGQSFAIAGLLQDNTTQTDNFLPGLGNLPILGSLFRSDSFLHNESELVIIVTPYIIQPANSPAALQDAGEGYIPPNDIERVLMLRQEGKAPHASKPVSVPGDAGFIVE